MSHTKITKKKHLTLYITVVIVALVAIGSGIEYYHRQKTSQNTPTTITNNSSSPANTSPDKTPVTNTNSGSPMASSSPGELATPTGTFVSNHRPSLTNVDLAKEESVCNTTPGATCEIAFSKDGTQRSLGAKTVNTSGVTIWDWTPSSLNLTTGSWQIDVTVSLNGKTKSAVDATALMVQP